MSAKFLLKDGRATAAAMRLCGAIETALKRAPSGAVRLHRKYYHGAGCRLHVLSGEHNEAIAVLESAGLSFIEGNDAPRGGEIGDYIELSREVAARFVRIVNAAQ